MPFNEFIYEALEKEKERTTKEIKEKINKMDLYKTNKIHYLNNDLVKKMVYILYNFESFDEYEEYKRKKNNEKLDYENFLYKFQSTFPEYFGRIDMLVKDVIKGIYESYIKNRKMTDCSTDKAIIIKEILHYAENVITYNTDLTLKFEKV